MLRLCTLLRGVEREANGLVLLAERIASAEMADGSFAVAQCLLEFQDEFAYLFLKAVFEAAAALEIEAPPAVDAESVLAKTEELAFSKCERWMHENARHFLMVETRLNRYVLDLMRRKEERFAAQAKRALDEVTSLEDAQYVLESLAMKADRECIPAVASAMGYVSESGQMVSAVRREAAELTGRLVPEHADWLPVDVRDDILGQLHGRFEDVVEVRLAAYEAAGKIAAPLSIVPLRSRLKTDRNDRGKKAIASALAAIRQRLLDERPELSDVDGLTAWLSHVAALGDASMLDHVLGFLSPLHADPGVRVAALECAGDLGDGRAIPAIDRLVDETSPSGEALQAARRAKARLQDRHDLPLLESLSEIFPEDSPALDLTVDYEAIFGTARLTRLSRAMRDTLDQWDAGHWDDFVTRLDGVCDLLVRHLYENRWRGLGLDEDRAKTLARKDYANRLGVSEFKRVFSTLQSMFSVIHDLRHEATTAHVEDADGGEKPGLGRDEAELALDQFRMVFARYVEEMSK